MASVRTYGNMGLMMSAESGEIARLRMAATTGDGRVLDQLIRQYRGRLKRMVRLRMNARLQGRIDDSDVLQEAFLDASRRLDDYLQDPQAPFFLWLRTIVGQKLLELHRTHLGTQMRDAGREVSLHRGALPAANSMSLAAQLLGRFTSPSNAAVKAERRIQLQEALNSMDEADREILAFRHFEQLTNAEVARELGIDPSAASKRYMRALARLQILLKDLKFC